MAQEFTLALSALFDWLAPFVELRTMSIVLLPFAAGVTEQDQSFRAGKASHVVRWVHAILICGHRDRHVLNLVC